MTCPDRNAHSDALKDLLNTTITSEIYKSATTEDDAELAAFGSALGTSIGGWVLDNMLTVENYFVCSVGYITYDGETHVISLGILNHVFTPDDEDIIAAAQELF